ncbi:MAG: response regulator, partial [Gammaproteobacteria bacterium]|nr:response regulator [Gammaproteobacteria bacterium]
LAISVDITEKKKMELALLDEKKRAEAASHAKSEFIANMSHDMRTPITAMLGVMRSLLVHIEEIKAISQSESGIYSEEKYQKILNELVDSAYQDNSLLMATTNELLILFNDVLEVICLESGQSKQTVESFAIRECLEHNKQLQQPVAQDKHLQLTYTISKHVPVYLTGIRSYLDRILLNLVSNGLKFTEKGLVHIHVSLKNDTEQQFKTGDTIQLKISVEDSGIGIPKDKFETIFEHFSRLTSSYNSGYKGAGLGLYAVKQYVNTMKGKIDVTSTVGKGSCFTVILPLTVSDHTDQKVPTIPLSETLNHQVSSILNTAERKKLHQSVSSETATRKVLIVEDHPLAAKAISLPLERNFNCAVDIVGNGTDAVEIAKKGDYHLIFMDIGLPDFCGIEATKRIRKFNQDVPIIALTGHAGHSDKGQEAKAAGMQAILTKPAKPVELEHILQQYSPDNKMTNQSEFDPCSVPDHILDKSEFNDVINWGNCVQQCNGDPNYARNLLSELVEDFENNVKQALSEIYNRQDKTAMREELHRIRGGVCYFDLPQLERALEALHLTLYEKEISSEKVKKLYRALQQYIDTFCMTWRRHNF